MTDREELIEWLWKLADGAESPPTAEDLSDHPDAPSAYYYRKHFQSLVAAFRAAEFDEGAVSSRIRGKYSDEELLEMLQEFGEELGHPPSSYEVQENDALASKKTFTTRFGDWQSVLNAAGFDEPAPQVHFQKRNPPSTWPTDEFPQTVSPDTIARTPSVIGVELTMMHDGDEQTLSSGRISVGGALITIDGFELAVTDRGQTGWLVRLVHTSEKYLVWLNDFVEFCDKTGVTLD
jgi:hypothetical protein